MFLAAAIPSRRQKHLERNCIYVTIQKLKSNFSKHEGMPAMGKNTWMVVLLIAAGAVVLLLSLYSNKPQSDQGVVISDIFHPASPASPPMVIETSAVKGHAGFIIQVYSFQDKNRAEHALQALKNNGYQAFMIMTDLGKNRVWYRVRVGGIADEPAAHKMLDDIRKTYNSGFILQTVDQ